MRLRDAQKWPRSEIKKSFVYFLFISTRVTHFSVFLFAREQIFQARGIKGGCKRIKWEKIVQIAYLKILRSQSHNPC